MAIIRSTILLFAASAVASPALLPRQASTVTVTQTASAASPTSSAWNSGAVDNFPIHSSCNATEAAQIKKGLGETLTIVRHARDHILRWGNSSEIYQKYFGNASTGEPIGWYTKIADGDKAGVLFRCDNPDGNCEQEGWAGHWRGENATSETVICPLSYEVRRPLEALCGFGWDVANGATNFYWASDLLHRLLHIPKVGEGIVEHYAEDYASVIELAQTESDLSVRDSDTLQLFALEAYAHDIAIPGEGCAGKYTATSSEAASATSAAASSSSVEAASATETPSPTLSEAPSATSAAAAVSVEVLPET
ncbi:Prenylated Rab acceptor protein 1 [Didymosphaeria variabile]|uniref:Prenylated Rab acceptor protein 1 n=1 Tax=Didymosphaeria variabile TaxID=1932322 RepID=A0A9W9CA37_9PLEO|nr:Prenylated Rab acceptor protein 1 [Didymosphaeria variabile]KAJ4351938.1 Prenylated Rab acceptor protein 1 [Didymosphaeria variabile]